ncbi:ABC transporter substrate-binding protein [Longispora urticae]
MRRVLAPLLAICLLASAAACGSSDEKAEKVKLTIGLFGDFGFKPLYEEYKATHPNIQIEERVSEFAAHHQNVTAHLATNTGAADIEAIEVGYISQFTAQPQKFHNLLDRGAGNLEGRFLPWKWQQGLSGDGKSLVGLGTDVGGMAMCYRNDLFAAAGLPTDRDAVSKLWPTWADYVKVGKEYKAKKPESAFFESSGNMFRAMVEQGSQGVYDKQNNLVVDSNPGVRAAWDTSVDAINAGMSAKLTAWTPEWTAAFEKGSFATIVCPAWMTSYIQTNAKNASGKWDVAAVPGGAGSMGGTHLTLPKQGKHAKEAYELISWLTAPAQQAKVFKATGNFPSTPELYSSPEITGFKKDFFNNAPIGQIFSDSAKAVKPQYMGPRTGDVFTTIGSGLGRIENGQQKADDAWKQVLSDVAKLK